MAWFKRKERKFKDPQKKTIPDGLWGKCPSCSEIIYKPELEKNLSVCHHCNHHFRVTPELYVNLLLDEKSKKKYYPSTLAYFFRKAYQHRQNIILLLQI